MMQGPAWMMTSTAMEYRSARTAVMSSIVHVSGEVVVVVVVVVWWCGCGEWWCGDGEMRWWGEVEVIVMT